MGAEKMDPMFKAEEAWERRKLTSRAEEEVGVVKEPRYLALCNGGNGVSRVLS